MAVLLVRHANAGNRDEWRAPDHVRPLSKSGRKQAEALAELLGDRPVTRVLSSPTVRCVETVEPLAERRGLTVEEHDALAEGSDADSVVRLARSVAGEEAVLCTHGDVIPTLLDALAERDHLELPDGYPCAKGSVWVLRPDRSGDRFVHAAYLAPPR